MREYIYRLIWIIIAKELKYVNTKLQNMTENQRKTKKLIIATIYGAFLISFFAGIYFLIPAPPEEEVIPEVVLIPPQVVEFKSFDAGVERADLVAVVDNMNSNYGLREFRYEFVIGAEGGESRTIRGTSYLLPGETKYIVELERVLEPGENLIGFELLNETYDWRELSRFELPQLIAQNLSFGVAEKPGDFFTARATISNQSGYSLNNIDVVGLIRSPRDEILAVNRTSIQTVLTNERRDIEFIWDIPLTEDEVGEIQVFPTTNVLRDSEFLRRQGITDIGR